MFEDGHLSVEIINGVSFLLNPQILIKVASSGKKGSNVCGILVSFLNPYYIKIVAKLIPFNVLCNKYFQNSKELMTFSEVSYSEVVVNISIGQRCKKYIFDYTSLH